MENIRTINKNQKKKIVISNNLILLIIFVILFIVFSFLDKGFLTYYNISTMLRNMVPTGIIAIGLTPVMISRGMDVSFGSNLSLTTVIIALLYNAGINIYLIIIIALLSSAAISFLNGVLIEYFNLNALITTLGSMSIYLALALVFSNGNPVGAMSDKLYKLSYGSIFKVPTAVWFFILISIIYYVILNYTVAGRTVYVIGANPQASYSVGVKVKKVRIMLYLFFGLVVGIAAVITTGSIGTGYAYHGYNLLLPVLSAILLSGIGLEGGSGTIWGTILGVLLVTVIFNGLSVMGVSSDKIQILQGVLLIIIVATYEIRSKKIKE